MDDLISREAVKEMIKNHRSDFSTEKDYRTARACVNAVPSAEPKRGKWERHYSRPNVLADLFWHCSECGYKDSENYAPVYHHFCTNCGADMREVTT